MTLRKMTIENFVRKRENVGNQYYIHLANVFSLDKANILLSVNCWPYNKFLDWSKLKAFAESKVNVAEKLKFVLGRVENIVGKGENAGYQHFLLWPRCFQKSSILWSLKVGIIW